MPIYEYRCSECGHQAEVLQKISEAPLTVCTACGKPAFTKLLSAAGFQLKGSGWYATDFKGPAKKPETKSEPKAEAKGEAKPEAKGETKPDPKPEKKSESKAAA
ncbi:MAG TPA: FmdB family zinc ribbon protein [Burkholderiales bacterium]|nr:FmdB family zinc ribbon protein [Burkholderiales bacterium]